MSRRQSLDRPGILSPPGPFLTPSPSPSISASPRLQPSPSLSPFPQDVLLVTGNPLTNNSTHEQERKTITPGRRQSIHQFTNGSPSAGTVVFQPSPSQSPAAATSVIGVTAGCGLNVVAGFPSSISQNTITTTLPNITTTGNEFNTTLVGSNNIQLNKKGTKRQQQQQQQQQQHHQIFSSSSHYSHLPSLSTTTSIAGGYGQSHATPINNTQSTFATTTVASTPKNQTKKSTTNSTTGLPISQQPQQQNQQPQQQQQQQQQQFQQYQNSSPLIADSPSPSPSGTAITSASIKPPTPQPPMQMLQQQFTIASNSNGSGVPQHHTFQLIQGPQGQLIATSTAHQQNQHLQQHQQQQQQQNRFNPTPTTNIVTSTAAGLGAKSTKAPQQILPKPQQLHQQQQQQQQLIHNQQQQQIVDQITLAQQQKSKTTNLTSPSVPVTSSSNMSQPSLTQISQSAQQGQQQQIILPSGATASLTTTAQHPLLLNQVPVLVQQNTPQGVQLILRPPTPQLTATPSLVIQNRAQPQLQQHQQPQQVLRILGTNGATMQLAAATPTFIVSSQANLIQQANHLQTIKAQSQSPAITQLSGLHAALSAAAAANSQQQRSQQFATTAATINGHLLSPSVAAQIQNLQLAAAAAANGNGLTAQIQMPNGLTTSGATALLSQLPGAAQFQQNSQAFNINLNQLSSANIQQIAAAAGAAFQTPPPPQPHSSTGNGQQQTPQNSGTNNTTANNTATNDLFANSSNSMTSITQSSPAHCPVAVTPEPLRQPTPVLQNISAASPQQQTHNPPQIHLSLNAAATIQLQQHQQQQQQAQIQQLQQQIQQTQNQVQQAQQHAHQIHQVQQNQCLPQQPQTVQQETKKKSKPRKKKPPASTSPASAASANNSKCVITTANKSLNTNTSTTSVLAPTITSTSNTIKMVPNTSQEQTGQQQITTNIPPTNQINHNMQDKPLLKSPSSPPPRIQRASNGKLDLGNVMKLCGITDEDDDFMDSSTTEESTPTQTLSSAQNFTISIPQPNSASETLPYTLSIPGVQSSTNQNENTESAQEQTANIVIKIDPSESGNGPTNASVSQPYSITIPRLPSQEEIQKQSQLHLNSLQNENNASQIRQQQIMLSAQPLNTNITFSMPVHSAASTMPPNNNVPQLVSNSMVSSNSISNTIVATSTTAATSTTTTATVKPRRKPAAKRNTKKDTNNTPTSVNNSIANSVATPQSVSASCSTVVTSHANILTSAISTPLATPSLVPSQIGNIQISQIDNRLGNNQSQMIAAPTTSSVENKIQIMPILDKNTNSAQMPQLQQTQTQIVFPPNNMSNSLTLPSTPAAQGNNQLVQQEPRQMQLVALPQLSNSSQASTTSTSNLNQQQSQPTLTMPNSHMNPTISAPANNAQHSLMPPVAQPAILPGIPGNVSISVGTPNTIAGIIPQLTGSLTLAVSEQCERLILRHDPNQPQDQQSQLILQALLKGALPNVTIINEPTKAEPPKPPTIQQPTLTQPTLTPTSATNTSISNTSTSTGAISKSNKRNNKQSTEVPKQPVTQNLGNQFQKPIESNANNSTTTNINNNLSLNSNLNSSLHLNLSGNPPMPPNVTLPQQRYIALPKIDPSTQQLFSLNPMNNQITPINSNQTTASIGPTERLLIAPAGINAQQLAQCLQQGQLHFNDVNPLTTQPALSTQQQQPMAAMAGAANNQQPKQQIVYPMTSQNNTPGMITMTTTATTTTSNTTTVSSSIQSATATTTTTSTTTKQVANVAPIIDQSKAKQDTKQINNSATGNTGGAVPRKKPVRKPKASTTTAADVALMKNASVVKPMPKLDPLSQKPNNNPVQIVQPNTASGKPVVSTSITSTTATTTSNVVTIQPFQTQTSTGTKLVGITAPMQQQPQNNSQQLQQTQQNRNQTNFNTNFSGSTNNIPTTNVIANLNTNPPINNLNSGLPLNNTNNGPSLVNMPANQPQHTVSRVQTIQLTPQQQQMFKQVQMQIQYLTVKLQHKNLLSSMPLPADLDPNVVAAFNKPMTDMEINTALQRLFMEQHRILAAGKEIPTPEPFLTNATNAANAANAANSSFPLMSSNNFTPDNSKANTGNIPANIVQPNNHSMLSANMSGTSNGAGSTTNTSISSIPQQQQTQKIHIYPIQQQQQQQQQNKQTKQTKQQQVNLTTTNLNPNSSIGSLTTPTSVASSVNSSNNKVTTKQKTNQPQQQQQQQMNLQQTPNNNTTTTNNLTTTLVNPPTLNPQLPQLSSLTTTPSLPSLPYPSLPPPHMINIANMPAVLQQKHFTQHLQMQQQQLMQQQQQQQQQKLQNAKSSNTFTPFNTNLNNLSGFQQGPPPLIFPTSATTTINNSATTIAITSSASTSTTVSTMPQLSALSQQQQPTPQSSQQTMPTQMSFHNSSLPTTTTFAVSVANQKAYIPIITGTIASVGSSVIQQTSVVSTSLSTSLNSALSALPQLITTTAASASLTTTADAVVSAPTSSVIGAAGSFKPLLTQAPSTSNNLHVNNSIVVQNAILHGGTYSNTVGNPIAQNQTVVKTEEQISPKAKLARLSLFLRQLEVDQKSCLNPDYKSPFQNKEEAVKRLIRYHCMYQTDEDVPSEEEEEFEKSAIKFQDKFRQLSGKFHQLLLQESMLQHRTSEICQMEKLMIEDLQQEIEDSKQLENDRLQYELQQQQQQQQQSDDQKDTMKDTEKPVLTNVKTQSPCSSTADIFDQIKNEVKSEPLDIKHNSEENYNNDSNSNFCNNLQSSSTSLDSIKNEIKGEPCDNSQTSSSGVKSSCSSLDSFDLLKQSPMVNDSFKKKTVDVKEPKKEEISNQWKQSYIDSKASNSYYNHLANASVNITKPANHVFNGVKKQQPVTPAPTATTGADNEIKKNEKESFENFDIESEITPSFIMKKQEPKELAQQPVNDNPVTTTAAAPIAPSNNSINTSTSATKSHSVKSVKQQVKSSHSFENNLHAAVNNPNANNFQQNQSISSSTTAAHTEVVTNNFDFSHHLPVNQASTKQQEDDWLCIQKELNLINTVGGATINTKSCENLTENSAPPSASEPLAKTLDFLSNAASDDLFPNGCINKNIDTQSQTNLDITSCNAPLVASSCSQQNQQPSLPLTTHEENQPAADLNEFFSGSEDSEVHKDVETRLEAMFGESPVHLSNNKERSDSPDDIESGLESIFGESNKSSSINHCVTKEKTNWESDFTGNAFMTSNQQHSTNFMPHHIQLGSANNPRWMQNMEAQFPDFLSSNNNSSAVHDCLTSRKRQWNGHIVDDNAEHVRHQTQQQQHVPQDEESPQKKMCDGSMNNSGLNDSSASSSSPLSLQQQSQTHHHHNLVPNDTSHAQELMDAALLSLHDGLGVDSTAQDNPSQVNGFPHILGHHENFVSYNTHMDNNQQQQSQHFMNINQHPNINTQQQQVINNHMMQINHHQQPSNIHGHHHAGTGEFDDDITRHVQNAIDSILNLQSSEADSLSFSLDHSMGSFLGDTILNDNQSGANNPASCQESTKRRQLVDDLGDCLMGSSSTGPTNLTETSLLMDTTGATAHSQLINSSLHHNSIQQQHHAHVVASANSATMNNHSQQQQQQLNDFHCVVSGIDEAVKSIMTS